MAIDNVQPTLLKFKQHRFAQQWHTAWCVGDTDVFELSGRFLLAYVPLQNNPCSLLRKSKRHFLTVDVSLSFPLTSLSFALSLTLTLFLFLSYFRLLCLSLSVTLSVFSSSVSPSLSLSTHLLSLSLSLFIVFSSLFLFPIFLSSFIPTFFLSASCLPSFTLSLTLNSSVAVVSLSLFSCFMSHVLKSFPVHEIYRPKEIRFSISFFHEPCSAEATRQPQLNSHCNVFLFWLSTSPLWWGLQVCITQWQVQTYIIHKDL